MQTAYAAPTLSYNLTQYSADSASRVSLPPTWQPNPGTVNYSGTLDIHWLAKLNGNNETAIVSRAHAISQGTPADFSLVTAADNCWGMDMGYGLVSLAQSANLTITVAADSSSIKPAFGFYRGWDTSASASRHDTIFFGDNNPLGTQGLTFLGDQLGNSPGGSVSRTFTNLAAGNYELFVTVGNNDSAGGAYKVTLTTTPVGGGITPPGAPTNVTATAGNAQASVSWSAPASNGGAPITSYTVTSAPGNKTCSSATTSCAVTGLTNGTSYTFTVKATNSAGTGATSAPSNSVTPRASDTPVLSRLLGISTRGQVGAGDNILIGGFILTGSEPMKVIIRAVGPSMSQQGVTGTLADPQIQLTTVTGTPIASNDDWQTNTNAEEISQLGMAPAHPKEAALMVTLPPGAYTPLVSGVGDTSGVGLVEIYEVGGWETGPRLTGISTRGKVGTGDNVMIGGFILTGSEPRKVIIRAVGPSMSQQGVTGTLADPQIQLTTVTGTPIASNDDWQTNSNAGEISQLGMAPVHPKEAALMVTLQPNTPYTPIVSGVDGVKGIGLVEVYEVQISPP